ncbi:hypothetical protein Nepgr_010289 [Nepenthes gracilis]|uniref:Bifunctional inhibitor/plant lipid transfer protein/seed storage helical domain-containing protein n=1 Tax=Nepenthes gracilis TaxID=150966 RepID=A0AAD3SD32_NEPGR|nr:hypothetical protein Nepgr_010289 [Nepenthes gracilis]
MATSKAFHGYFPALALALVALISIPSVAYGQLGSSCTASMLASFNPCMNFLSNSSATSPTADCCSALKSFLGSGTACLCQIVTAGVPFRVPINRTVAISLPKSCNMARTPVQCKASSAPVPAPGPIAFGPALSPAFALPPTVPNSAAPAAALAPLSPASTSKNSSSVIPSSAVDPTLRQSPPLVLFSLAVLLIIKNF